MLRKHNMFKILISLAFAVTILVLPFRAYAQDVDCPENAEDYWELYLTQSEERIREVAMQCMEGMSAETATADSSEAESAASADDREKITLKKGVVTEVPGDYTCVGEATLDGETKYDNKAETGTVIYLTAPAVMVAQFGDMDCWPGDIRDDANAQQLENGCGSKCADIQPIVWPEETAADTPTSGHIQVDSNADLGDISAPISVRQQGSWTVYEINEIDEGEDYRVGDWIDRLQNPAPELWPVFPNVENKLVPDFPHQPCEDNPDRVCVPAGVEYGVPNVPFCQQDMRCDFIVPAWHYRLITADYEFQGMECKNTDDSQKGCLLLLINVMNKSYAWRNQIADNGFTVAGLYFDGNRLEWGTLGLVSHSAASMLNMRVYRNPLTGDVLNSGDGANAGANCSQVEGCPYVNATVVVHAGNRILAVLKTTVTRPTK